MPAIMHHLLYSISVGCQTSLLRSDFQAPIHSATCAVLEIGQAAHQAIPPVPGVEPKPWEGLSALQKLNAVSGATDVPVADWIEANRTGAKPTLAQLQLSVLAYRKS